MNTTKSFNNAKTIIIFVSIIIATIAIMAPKTNAAVDKSTLLPSKSAAKAVNSFEPSIKIDKSNISKVKYTLRDSDKIKEIKVYAIINGVVSHKNIGITDKTINSNKYITGFTFNKEGMFRIELLNSNSQKYVTDYIFEKVTNADKNANKWNDNQTPKVYTKTSTSSYRSMIIKDGNIQSIEILKKEHGTYNNTIYRYSSGKEKLKNSNYIGATTMNDKKTKIKVNIKRQSSKQYYLIIVKDKFFTRKKYISVYKDWQTTCEDVGKKLVRNNVRYNNNKDARSLSSAISKGGCNCGEYVSYCLQKYGILSSKKKQVFYFNGSLKVKGNNTPKYLYKYATLYAINKSVARCYENGTLKSGDICGFKNGPHTNIYVGKATGKNSSGKLKWNDAGTAATKNGNNTRFIQIANLQRKGKYGINGTRKITHILRLNFKKIDFEL